MARKRIYALIAVTGFLVLVAAVGSLARERGKQPPEPSPETLDCCQCTALGEEQHYPYPAVPGETCHEHCFAGCLERGHPEIVCKLGNVTGYALACPDVLMPTVTPFGE